MTRLPRPRRGLRVVLVLVLAALATGACGGDGAGAALAGMVREPAPDVSSVTLPEVSAGGTPMRFRAAPGGILVAYFGYLSCPDVCPTTMSDLRAALGKLTDAERSRVSVVMITVDPGRDSADALTAYVRGFVGSAGRAARTDDDRALRGAAEAFGADYSVTTKADGAVEVSHTAYVYAVDDQGRLRLTWPFGIKAPQLQNDLRQLLRTGRAGA